MAYPWELSFALRHLLYVTCQLVMKDNLSKEQVFPWPPESPHKKWMSHQQDNLTEPNRQSAHSVSGEAEQTAATYSHQSVSHSQNSAFHSGASLILATQFETVHSNSLTHITARLRSHTPSPARPADRHPPSHASPLMDLLSLPFNILSLHTLNNTYLSLL